MNTSNPNGTHGKGTLFLNSFLKRIGIEPVDGKWIVTVESDRIDILLHRVNPPSVVIIENKSCNATDQPGQLYRYWFRQIHQRYPNLRYDDMDIRERFRIIYLPPGGYSRPAETSLLRPADKVYSACGHARLPKVEQTHRHLLPQVRPGATQEKREDVLAGWYRDRLREDVPPLIARWEPMLGVKVKKVFIQHMKTKWGGCSPQRGTIRLNSELAKKPPECLEYLVVHERAHLLEPTHNERFIALMDRFMPNWRNRRNLLNSLPVRHESWGY